MLRLAMQTAGLLVLLGLSQLPAETVQVRTAANRPFTIALPVAVDDVQLQEPRSYHAHETQRRQVVRRVTLRNVSQRPLHDVELVANGRDFSSLRALQESLALPADASGFAKAGFSFWIDSRFHGTPRTKETSAPLPLLRFWGFALCGDETAAFGRFLGARGIAGRHVPLNGHVAGEYYFDGKWNVLDTDQNLSYPLLDNRTLASAQEIRDDPFLALRTRPFGRHAPMSAAAAQFNCGLFERIDPGAPQPLRSRAQDFERGSGGETLHPGEQLSYLYDQWPPVGESDAATGRIRAAALAMLRLDRTPKSSGEKTTHPLSSAEADGTVLLQRSRASLPLFRAGENQVIVRALGAGEITVTLEYEPIAGLKRTPPPILENAAAEFAEVPRFPVRLADRVDRLWWQISEYPDFAWIAPNLDRVEKAAAAITMDALSATFLSPGRPYYLRVKACRDGVWSPWSDPHAFRIEKPAAPEAITVAVLPGGRVRLRWRGAEADEFILYGSNRLDFLPERYASEEIVAMEGVKITESRPNRNEIARSQVPEMELQPTHRFMRLLARRGEAWSVPSELIQMPPTLPLPAPTIFQVRWSRRGERDVYVGREHTLPAPAPMGR